MVLQYTTAPKAAPLPLAVCRVRSLVNLDQKPHGSYLVSSRPDTKVLIDVPIDLNTLRQQRILPEEITHVFLGSCNPDRMRQLLAARTNPFPNARYLFDTRFYPCIKNTLPPFLKDPKTVRLLIDDANSCLKLVDEIKIGYFTTPNELHPYCLTRFGLLVFGGDALPDFEPTSTLYQKMGALALDDAWVTTPNLQGTQALRLRGSIESYGADTAIRNIDWPTQWRVSHKQQTFLGRRPEQQDSLFAGMIDHCFVAAVSDGHEESGNTWSPQVLTLLQEGLKRRNFPPQNIKSDLNDLLGAIDRKLYQNKQQGELNEGGATFAALISLHGRFFVPHIGDSRVYQFSPEEGLKQLTQDHVWKDTDVGVNRDRDNKLRFMGSLVARSFGDFDLRDKDGAIGMTAKADIQEVFPNRGDIFLICSDGLTNAVTEEELQECFTGRTLEEVKQKIQALLQTKRLHDNTTYILVQIS